MGFGGLVEGAIGLLAGTGSTPSDTGGAFVIEELSGQKRVVSLSGRGMPYRPFELGVSQRISTTWLPGYAEATATILGAKEEPSVINGYWKDRFIAKPDGGGAAGGISQAIKGARNALVAVSGSLSGGFGEDAEFKAPITKNKKPVESVRDAIELFDSITREGQLLQVTWDAQRRQGFLEKWSPKWHNAHDCEWEMSFTWISRGEKPKVEKLPKPTASTIDEIRGAVADLAAIVDEVGAIADELDDLVVSQMQALLALVEQMQNAVTSVNKLVNLPSSATRRIASTLYSVVAQAKAIGHSFELQPFAEQHRNGQRSDSFGATTTRSQALTQTGSGNNVTPADGAAKTSAVDVIGRAQVAHQVKRASRKIASIAAMRRAEMLASIQSDLRAIYEAKQGEHLRDIAVRFTGDANEWKRIMMFNGLSDPFMVAGQVIMIPKDSAEGFCASLLP
jgi:hypothetical protein